jgi:hypothetical protein
MSLQAWRPTEKHNSGQALSGVGMQSSLPTNNIEAGRKGGGKIHRRLALSLGGEDVTQGELATTFSCWLSICKTYEATLLQ